MLDTGAIGMVDGAIPAAVERFIAACIPSVAHLEALLLLRSEPTETWTTELMAARLFIRSDQAARVLADLVRSGLITTGHDRAEFRYAPADSALAADVEQTAETYRVRLVALTQRIHARQPSSLQAFADAFRVRKD